MLTPEVRSDVHASQRYEDQAEIESAIIGSILVHPPSVNHVSLVISPTYFVDQALGQLFACLVDMQDAGLPCDVKSIFLRAKGIKFRGQSLSEAVGGLGGFARLSQAVASPGNIVYYAQQLRRSFFKRRLRDLGNQLVDDADNWSVDPEQSLAVIEHYSNLVNARTDEVVTLQQAAVSAISTLRAKRDSNQGTGIPTGFVSIDSGSGGMYDGDLIIVGARPSIGKTSFGTQVAMYNAARGRKSLIVSIEMSAEDIAVRQLAAELGVSVRTVRSGYLDDDALSSVSDWVNDATNNNLLLWSVRDVTVAQIRAMARLLKVSKQLKFVVIDYLGLIKAENQRSKRYEQVTQVVGDLKSMAMELKLPVMALCQLGRGAEGSKPTLSDLRESGSIEQDADVVLLMHRKNRAATSVEIEIAKMRNGETGHVDLDFDGATTTFKDKIF